MLKLYSQIRTYETESMAIYFRIGMQPVSSCHSVSYEFEIIIAINCRILNHYFYLQLWFWYVTGGNVWPVFHSLHTGAHFLFITTSRVHSPSYWMGIGSSVRGCKTVGSQLIIYWHWMLRFRMREYIVYIYIYIFCSPIYIHSAVLQAALSSKRR